MPAPSTLNPFRPLSHRNFRLFWGGQTLSLIGTWMQSVAQGWLALELSNNPFLVGLVSAAGSFPVLVLSLYGGVVADRTDKLRLVTIAQSLLLVQAAMLWWFTASNRLTYGLLLALATAGGVISAFEIPARQSLIVELVGPEDLVDAIALNSGGFNLARILGPSAAAIIIATAGLAWAFGANTISYLAVLAGLLMIRLPPWQPRAQVMSPIEGIREGVRYIRSTREVNVLMRVIAITSIFGLPYLAMMPVVARNVLRTGAAGYGVLLTCVGVGALAGALALAGLTRYVRRGRLFTMSAYAFPVLLMIFSLVRWLPLAAVVLVFVGFAMLLSGSLANGMLQSIVPDALRGRVMSAYVFVYVGFAPIGAFLAGAVARVANVEWAIGGGGAITLAYVVWTLKRHPELGRV